MRKSIFARLALTLVISAAIGFTAPVFVHRSDFDRAFIEWERNKNPETEVALEAQRREHQKDVITTRVWASVIVFCLVNGIWFGISSVFSGREIVSQPATK
jgi:hypothetical protein